MINGGYIKINRKTGNREWYTDIKRFKLYLHLLLFANREKQAFSESPSENITKSSHGKFTLFTVVNYDDEQGEAQANPKRFPNISQTNPNNRINKE